MATTFATAPMQLPHNDATLSSSHSLFQHVTSPTFGQVFSQPSDKVISFPSTRVVEEEVEYQSDDDAEDGEAFLAAFGDMMDGTATLTSTTAAASSSFFTASTTTNMGVAQYHLQAASRPCKEQSLRRGLLLPPRRKRSSAAIMADTFPTDTQPSPLDDNNDKLLEALATISDTFASQRPDLAYSPAQHQQMHATQMQQQLPQARRMASGSQLKDEQHVQIQAAAAQVAAAQHQLQRSFSQSSMSSTHSNPRSSAVSVNSSPYASPRSSAGSFAGFEAEFGAAAAAASGFSGAFAAVPQSVSLPASPYNAPASPYNASPYSSVHSSRAGSPYGSPRASFSQLAPMHGSAGPVRRQRSASPRLTTHRTSNNSVIAAVAAEFEAAAVAGTGMHVHRPHDGSAAMTHAVHHYATASAAQQNGHSIPLQVTFSNPQMLRSQAAAAYKEVDGTWSATLTDLPTIELNAFLKRSDFSKEESQDLKKVRRQRKNQVYTKRSRDRRSNLKPAHSE